MAQFTLKKFSLVGYALELIGGIGGIVLLLLAIGQENPTGTPILICFIVAFCGWILTGIASIVALIQTIRRGNWIWCIVLLLTTLFLFSAGLLFYLFMGPGKNTLAEQAQESLPKHVS